jgi:hypothetical protein
MKHTIVSALENGWPGCEWALSEDGLQWFSTNKPKPTMEEIAIVISQLDAEEAMRLLRQKRNAILKDTDVYALPDFPHSTLEKRNKWLAYRQQLRDLTNTANPLLNPETYELDLDSIEWPQRP